MPEPTRNPPVMSERKPMSRVVAGILTWRRIMLYALVMAHNDTDQCLELTHLTWEELCARKARFEANGWWEMDIMEQWEWDLLDDGMNNG